MADRRDHFGGYAGDYARARPDYPAGLFDWLAGQTQRRDAAWDCAAGSGQASAGLARHFGAVIATDLSQRQLAAMPAGAVLPVVARGESVPLTTACVDAVTVAQGLHWLDTAAFFREVEWVLRPGGVLAVWGYALCAVAPAIDAVVRRFHDDTLAAYWPQERWWVAAGYPGLTLPWPELAAPAFGMARMWTRDAFLDYVATWSGVKRAEAAGAGPMAGLARELDGLWGEGPRRVRWPLTLRVARRPA